ncbi:hypothetical protein D3C84_924610 [compost metagenome]
MKASKYHLAFFRIDTGQQDSCFTPDRHKQDLPQMSVLHRAKAYDYVPFVAKIDVRSAIFVQAGNT